METDTSNTPQQKMANYRAAMRAQGLRAVQIWVPDTRVPHYQKEAQRQSLLVANHVSEASITQWLEEVADTDGWKG